MEHTRSKLSTQAWSHRKSNSWSNLRRKSQLYNSFSIRTLCATLLSKRAPSGTRKTVPRSKLLTSSWSLSAAERCSPISLRKATSVRVSAGTTSSSYWRASITCMLLASPTEIWSHRIFCWTIITILRSLTLASSVDLLARVDQDSIRLRSAHQATWRQSFSPRVNTTVMSLTYFLLAWSSLSCTLAAHLSLSPATQMISIDWSRRTSMTISGRFIARASHKDSSPKVSRILLT